MLVQIDISKNFPSSLAIPKVSSKIEDILDKVSKTFRCH